MSLPTDSELVKQVHAIIVKAYETDTIAEHSKRKVREMLTDHFGVDLESKKKAIGEMIQGQVNLVSATREQEVMRSHASTSRSASPAKASRSSKAAKSKTDTKKKSSTKRKAASSDEDGGETGDDKHDGGEQDYEVTAAASATDPVHVEEEDTFSELEDDTSVARARKTSKSSKFSKCSPSTSKPKKSATSRTSSGGSEAEQRLARLKKLVIECGVRKPWKKLYEAAGVADSDFSGQCQVVSNVLKELGMTGKGSIEQARKIRDQREFADELAALQENEVIDNDDDDDKGGRRARRTRGSVGGASKRGGGRTITISDDSDDDTVASDFEDEASVKRTAKKARTSTTASRANKGSDSDDSEDEGPTRRSFKSSLASFAADLNSDSD